MSFPTPIAGDELGGYELLSPLGKGGAGVVWEVRDEGGAHFALKLLHPAIAADPASRKRLAREASTLNKIRDRGVASVVDLETEGSHPFVVTELIRGLTLRDDLRENGPMVFEDALAIAKSLKSTLETVHVAGVIHRDLKPSNIILGDACPVLIDFGIAQSDDDDRLTATGLVSGTPGWVAPEVLRGNAPDEGSDWWAWSAILLNMLTARQPYGSGGFDAIATRQHLNHPDLEGVYPPLAQILKRALGPREGRPSATEILADLNEFDPETVDTWDPQTSPQTTVLSSDFSIDEGGATSVIGVDNGETSVMSADDETSVVPADDGTSVVPVGDETSAMPVERRTIWPQNDESDAFPEDTDETRQYGSDAMSGGLQAADGQTRAYPVIDHRDQEVARFSPQAGSAQPGYPVDAYGNPVGQYGIVPGQTPDAGPVMGPNGPVVPAGTAGPAGPMMGYPGPFGWMGYKYSSPPSAILFGLGMASLVALLPVLWSVGGILIAVAVLILAETVGFARTWREKRRVAAGEARSGDNWLATLAGIPLAIRAALSIAFDMAIAILIVGAAWSLYTLNMGGSAFENPFVAMLDGTQDLSLGTLDLVTVAALWVSNLFIILVCRVGVGGWHLREGTNAIASTILPGRLARNLAGIAGILIAIGGISLVAT